MFGAAGLAVALSFIEELKQVDPLLQRPIDLVNVQKGLMCVRCEDVTRIIQHCTCQIVTGETFPPLGNVRGQARIEHDFSR